jgi:hypothetical protein
MKENLIQKTIINDLSSFYPFVEFYKIIKTNDNGNHDLFVSSKATGPFLLELKKEDGVKSKIQEHKSSSFSKCGINCYTIWSIDGYINLKKHLKLNISNLKEKNTNVNDYENLEFK